MKLQTLTADDVGTFQDVRLRALREHPEAFGQSFEVEKDVSVESVATHLQRSSLDAYQLGAFKGDELVGILGFFRRQGPKLQHKAMIGGMYVEPRSRGKGVGRALLLESLRRAKALSGLEEVVLAVTVGNERARQLYTSVGFVPYCLDARFICVGGRYYDIEWLALRL